MLASGFSFSLPLSPCLADFAALLFIRLDSRLHFRIHLGCRNSPPAHFAYVLAILSLFAYFPQKLPCFTPAQFSCRQMGQKRKAVKGFSFISRKEETGHRNLPLTKGLDKSDGLLIKPIYFTTADKGGWIAGA